MTDAAKLAIRDRSLRELLKNLRRAERVVSAERRVETRMRIQDVLRRMGGK